METLERSRLFVPKGGLVLGDKVLRQAPEVPEAKVLGYRRDGSPILPISGGAFSVSGLYVANWIDILDATQLAINTSLTTHKWALYTNTLTPNYSTDVSYSATNEVGASGTYVAGGTVIASPTTTESPAGTLMYDMADQAWTSATITARGAILYADALAADNLIVGMTFGSDFTSTAGTFTIQFNALGVFTIDLTP
jgi:hypothetical protein